MILYHGSKFKLDKLQRRQAMTGDNADIPQDELLNAIYFTPDYDFAFASAARPYGFTQIERDKTISFEHPELFDPKKKVYIYSIDSENIPAKSLKKVDDLQYAVLGIDEIRPDGCEERVAEDVFKLFKLIKYKK